MQKNHKNIVIAGVGRAGKSTLSKSIVAKTNFRHFSMDSLINAFGENFSKTGITHGAAIEEVSPNVALLIETISEIQENTIFDLDKLLPVDYIKYINKEKNDIYFLVYNLLSIEEKLEQIRKHDTKYDYSTKLSDDTLRAWISDYIKRSAVMKEQCDKYGLICIDMSFNREEKLEQLENEIISKYK